MKSCINRLLSSLVFCFFCLSFSTEYCHAAVTSQDYCVLPPYIAQSLPPLVMLDVGRDHKLYYQAYNDAADLDGDGKLDIGYTHTIDYYGYFDSNKCYTYDSTAKQFNPVATTTTKFCSSGQWSGNALNWLTMTRMDALKKVLYGGHRSTDTATNTLLQRVYVPNDAHSWGKELTGKLCNSGTTYTTNCSTNADCDSGYTCNDIEASGKYLVPFAAATTPTTCTAVAPTSVSSGSVLVARYKHASSKSCNVGNSAGMIASYEPGNLFASPGLVTYVGGFEDASLDPGSDHWGSDYNILATTTFTADATGVWWFAVDGDDDVEVQIGPAGVAGGGTVVAQYLGCHGASGGQSHNGSITLTAGTQYTIVARHFEAGGGEGVRVWFKRPPTTNSTTSTTTTSTSTNTTYTNSGTIAAAITACTANSGVLSGGRTSTGLCTSTYRCACTITTTTTTTTPVTPTCPANTTLLVSGSNYTCTPNNWIYVTSNSATTGSTTGLYAPLSLFAPDIVSGNECAIMSTGFVTDGIPQVGTSAIIGADQRHLFCSTTAGSATPTDEPILRVLTNRAERIWAWSAKERPVCDNSLGTPTDYSVRVKVCDSSFPETNCKAYGTSLKPTGLLHKYGEGDGTKVCSKNFSKTCSTAMDVSSDCATGEGLCVYKSPMYFGMMSGSYTNNTQGGVLRKNVTSIQEEITPANGTFTGTAGIISTFDKFRIATFSGGTYSCGWVTNSAITNGQCNDWGNPMGEILYETLRYFAGKGTANTDFTYDGTDATLIDNKLGLSKPSWGITKGATTYQPYDIYPSCSRPFALILSDINPSYDGDQIPGSAFNTAYAEDSLTPQLKLGVAPSAASGLSTYNATSLLRAITNLIGTTERLNENNKKWFVGQSGSDSSSICSDKTVTDLSLVQGLCPEEPTKLGTYYLPAVAYYGKTQLKANTGNTNMDTYAVALASPVADLKIKVDGGNYVTIAPTGKSVSGSLGVYGNCANKLTFPAYDVTGTSPSFSGKGLVIPSSNTAFCPTNQIVNFFIDDIRYVDTDVVYASFRINFEDVEQGADHDMDAIVKYEICTATARTNKYGTCGDSSTTPALTANQFQIKMNSEYAAGGIDQVMGFTLSGTGSTTTDGTYLLIKDADVSGPDGDTPAVVANMPPSASRVFTASGTASGFLKNPLWYAAKWGSFKDGNSNKIPDATSEWAKNDGVNPDNYYLVVNPLKLEQQLDKALTDITKSTSSGTAASILNNSEGSGATLLQAIFYPKKSYENQTSVSWSGELMNLWYYVDPFFNLSTIREDTDYTTGDHAMDIAKDKRIQFYFDDADSTTKIRRFNFDNTTELADFNADVSGGLKTMWMAGKLLWKRNLATDARLIYSTIDAKNFTDFSMANAASLSTRMNAEGADATAQTAFATKVINYAHGTDVCLDSSSPCTNKSRNRTVDINVTDTTTESHVWKLGDIISSTPKIQAGVPLQSYDLKPPLGYSDSTYKSYYSGSNYKNRGMVYVGANDGMLHAFKLGKMEVKTSGTQKATLSGTTLGREEWAFIPKNALPYLKYLTLPDYDNSHLYLVDGTNALFDISTKTVSTRDDYWNETRTASTWKTVLLGGMGLGGASKTNVNGCTDKTATGTCVKTPFDAANTYGATHGFSSYFAIDVTNQDFNQDSGNQLRAQPTLLWEFSNPALGYSTSGPAIIRIKPKPAVKDDASNGRWFAVYASGPTGPIDTATKQFKGKSDQNLKLFVVDIEKGPVVDTDPKKNGLWIIDTGIAEAFAGTISNNAVIDAEMVDPYNKNLRQDDVLYVGYTKKASDGTWTDGGVLRLVIPDVSNPDVMFSNVTDATTTDVAAWKTSKVIDGIGPVTTTVSKLMSKNNLYLFFGTGRYFYPQDDMSTTHRLFMVKEKCYPDLDKDGKFSSDITPSCPNTDATHLTAVPALGLSDLTSKNTPSSTAVANGWYIDLDAGERVVTDTVATVNGAVFYTSFKPTTDVCLYGGKSYLWGVQYDTGNTLPAAAQKGKILIQLSTGSFAEIDLSTALTDKGGRRTAEASDLSFGKASADPGLFMTSAGLNPVKRILHIQERYK